MVHLKKFREGTLWSGYRAIISFILIKQIFINFFRHGDRFYNRYINTTDILKYLDDDGSGVKPKHLLQMRMRYTSGGDIIQEMWNRDRKIARENFGRKRKPAEFIFLPGEKCREAEGHLSMGPCLKYAVINSAPRIGKYINNMT